MMNNYQHLTLKQQQGAVTILVSIVMLLLVTMVVLTTSKTVLMEQKIASNMVRSEQSLEAAETGLQEALNWLGSDPAWSDVITTYSVGSAFLIDTDGDGTLDSNTDTLTDGSRFTLIVGTNSDLLADPPVIEIQSTGDSDDGVAHRVVSRLIKFIDPTPFPLDNPIMSGGTTNVTGAAARIWNPEGHSTVWSGDAVQIGQVTNIADPDDASYPDCMETPMSCTLITSSTNTLTGLDVVERDSSLAALTEDEFFVNFFGMSKIEYQNTVVTLDVTPQMGDRITNEWDAASPGVNHAQDEVIWVDGTGRLSGNNVSGCVTSNTPLTVYSGEWYEADTCSAAERTPSIIIIEGDLHLTGTFDHYGIIYVTGDLHMTGTSRVEGAVVVAGEVQGNGTLDIWYNSEMVDGAGAGTSWGGTDGGWRDFL